MQTPTDHEIRSRELADSLRKFLIGINTGAIGIAFSVAGVLLSNKVDPGWVVMPIAFFACGLVSPVGSIFLAQHRELRRRDAKNPPKFPWYQTSVTWNAISFIFFVVGVVMALFELQVIKLPI